MANKRKNHKALADKYERANKLAAARQRKHKASKIDEQLEKKCEQDRKRYHRLREEKKIKVVKEMTEVEKKKYRKIWMKKQATYRKKKAMEECITRFFPQQQRQRRPTSSSHFKAKRSRSKKSL